MDRFCKDCRYFNWNNANCNRPEAGRDPVWGGSDTAAWDMRKQGKPCGPEGALWAEPPPEPVIITLPPTQPPRRDFWQRISYFFGLPG